MKSILFSILLILLVQTNKLIVNSRQVSNQFYEHSKVSQCFRSAVYEHVIVMDPIDRPIEILNSNLRIFERVTQKASKFNVNMILFPEYGLIPQLTKNDTLNKGVATFFPSLNTRLCGNKIPKNETEQINDHVVANKVVLHKLSCMAAKNNLYLTVNLVELEKNQCKKNTTLNNQNDDYLLYNTLVTFDDKGTLIAKYRKYNLFGEPAMTQTNEPQLVTFDSKYGKFGLAICADSLFKNPINDLVEKKKIDHLLFSTAWFDSFSFVSTLGFHSSLAIKYNINVLSSNNRNLLRGSVGSGIYTPNDIKIQTYPDKNLLIIADLPRANSNLTKEQQSNECNFRRHIHIGRKEFKEFNYLLRNQNFLAYKPVITFTNVLKSKRLNKRVDKIDNFCAGDVCCNLEYEIKDKLDNYHLIISSKKNHTHIPKLYQYEEGCSVSLLNESGTEFKLLKSSTHFKKLKLTGKFNSTVIYPNVISSKLELIPKKQWSFNQTNNVAEISLINLKKSINFVNLFVRNYDKYIKDPFRS